MLRYSCILVLLLLCICVSNISVLAQKRGIAYGHHYPEDMEVMSPQISWWYNWSDSPESRVANKFADYNFEFVPMTWNGSFNETRLREYLSEHPEAKYLLAFNEPNFLEQANMKPSAVAALWPKIEAIADEYNLEIVSPAVNFCGNCVRENGVHYTDPVKYLDDFFEACPDCRVDHIAVHCYMNHASSLEWFIGLFKKYKKPIWLTEFAGWESNNKIKSIDDQIDFMIDAVEYLENDTSVFRYSWFIGRGSGINSYPHIDVLGKRGQLTSLGEVYKYLPVHDEKIVVNIPAKIEAESYTKMKGIALERTTDSTGHFEVSSFNSGDWLDYKIKVSNTGTYPLKLRIASSRALSLIIKIDGKTAKTIKIPNYEGIENWNTFVDEIHLDEGEHRIKIGARSSGSVLNWIQIGETITPVSEEHILNPHFTVFPNPSQGILNISTNLEVKQLYIYNLAGLRIRSIGFTEVIHIDDLSGGIYFICAIDKNGRSLMRKKVVLNK